MGHLAVAVIHLCGTGLTNTTTASGGGGSGTDVSFLVEVFGTFTGIGLIAAVILFLVLRRLPPPGPAPIPIWNQPPRS